MFASYDPSTNNFSKEANFELKNTFFPIIEGLTFGLDEIEKESVNSVFKFWDISTPSPSSSSLIVMYLESKLM